MKQPRACYTRLARISTGGDKKDTKSQKSANFGTHLLRSHTVWLIFLLFRLEYFWSNMVFSLGKCRVLDNLPSIFGQIWCFHLANVVSWTICLVFLAIYGVFTWQMSCPGHFAKYFCPNMIVPPEKDDWLGRR